MRLLSNGWTDFHQIFIKRRLCGVIRSPYLHENRSPTVFFVGAQDVHFLERKFRLCCFRTVAARKRGGILGKLKQMVQLQYLGYPHIYVW